MSGRWPGVLFLVSLVVSCGGGGDQSSVTGSPVPTTSVPTTAMEPDTTAPSSTIGTTAVPRSTTTVGPADGNDQGLVLRPDGLGPVDFGTPGDQAVETFTRILGPPDLDDTVDPDRQECVEGSRWRECVPVFETARILTWTSSGLDVLITDLGSPDGADPSRVPVYFGAWRTVRPANGAALSTADGVGPGIAVGEIEGDSSRDRVRVRGGHPQRGLRRYAGRRLLGQIRLDRHRRRPHRVLRW